MRELIRYRVVFIKLTKKIYIKYLWRIKYMKKLLIWGMGMRAKRLCHYLNYDEVEIIGFTDNEDSKDIVQWNGYPYLPKEEAIASEYDYIVIASIFYGEITAMLILDGVEASRIIQAYNVQFMVPNTLYFFHQVERDEEKYKIFTDINLFSCERYC